MEAGEAIEKAMKDGNVKKIIDDGFFLASAFSSLKKGKITEWILLFFNSKTKKTIDCYVTQNINLDEEMPAMKELTELNTEKIKISAEKAVETAKSKFSGSAISTLITITTKERVVISITFISAALQATIYDIDAENGEILREESANLARRA